jgi:hypothetical protein
MAGCRRTTLIWHGLAVCACLFGASAGAQDTARVRSMAAFASMNAATLASYGAVRPLDKINVEHAALLGMVAWLDSTVGKQAGLASTRIRWWEGGTQSYPTQGILIDDKQIASFLGALIAQKGRAGVPKAEARRRLAYALRFMAAHEYAHLLQYQVLGLGTVGARRLHRSIECSADLLAGMMYSRYLRTRLADDSTREVAKLAASHFANVVGSNDWLDDAAHPTPRLRQTCIEVGLANAPAFSLTFLKERPRDSTEEAFQDRMRRQSPKLFSGETSIVQWSVDKASQLFGLAAQRPTSDVEELSVVSRDTTIASAIARIIGAALRGTGAMSALEGPPAPTREVAYVLRESFPEPWECTLVRLRQAPAGRCVLHGHQDDDAVREIVEATVLAVSQGLKATDWTLASQRRSRAAFDSTRTFDVRGRGALKGRRAQIDVLADRTMSRSDMVAQQPPPYSVTVTVRTIAPTP